MSRRSWHQPRRDGYAVICEHCDHVHLGAPGEACHNSENREHLCGCTGTPESVVNLCERSDTMAKKGSGEKVNGQVVLSKETRSLKVILTNKERLDLGDQMARAIQSKESAEGHKTEAVAQFKSEIERHQAEAARIARSLANGYEFREVECEVRPLASRNGDAPQVDIVRTDTGEVVQTRGMTPSEMQRALPLPNPSEAGAEA